MKFVMMRVFLAACVLLLCTSLTAQEPADDEAAATTAEKKKAAKKADEPRDIRYLSSPLSDVRTNILDVERTGYFAIDAVDFRTRASGDEAIVWKVRVKKPVTYRHTEAMLREFRDVRFYSTIEKQKLEVVSTLMFYSNFISLGASSGKILGTDEMFELWIDLPTTFQQKILSLHADTLVLRRWRY